MTTAIQWTDETWNPTVGCDQVSPGCDHCYAKTLHDMRHRAVLNGKRLHPQYAAPFETVQLMRDRLTKPLSWRRPRRVFVNSVSDLFHKDIPDEFIDEVFAVMAIANRHTFQVLTKRAGRMRSYLNDPMRLENIYAQWHSFSGSAPAVDAWPLPNVWCGVSVENRPTSSRIHVLRETQAAVRFVSFEPLLESVTPGLSLKGINWAIVGGESSAEARPFDLQWARDIVDLCRADGTAPFVKQLGRRPYDSVAAWLMVGRKFVPSADHAARLGALAYHDKHGGDMAEWPDDLRVREYPHVSPAHPPT